MQKFYDLITIILRCCGGLYLFIACINIMADHVPSIDFAAFVWKHGCIGFTFMFIAQFIHSRVLKKQLIQLQMKVTT